MPGNYHIVHANAGPIKRRVRCYETGRDHRHQTHMEEFFQSACGQTLSRRQFDCCNITIADPSWKYNWCHDCVKAFPWAEEGRRIWLEKHGIATLDYDSWKEQLLTPDADELREQSV